MGEQLIKIPIVTPKEPLIMVNKTTSRALDVALPETLMARAIVVE